ARCSTSTAGSAASISSGPGPQRGWPHPLSVESCEGDHRHVFTGELPVPPPACPAPLVRVCKPVTVVPRAEKARRVVRERIRCEKRQGSRVPLQQPLKQCNEPFVLWPRRKRLEPHQPVQAEMIRSNLQRATQRIARFSFELVLAPFRGAGHL